jgi:hypothetical protein
MFVFMSKGVHATVVVVDAFTPSWLSNAREMAAFFMIRHMSIFTTLMTLNLCTGMHNDNMWIAVPTNSFKITETGHKFCTLAKESF